MLKKLFIKDYKNVQNPDVRIKYGVTAGAFGIVTNVILFIFKLFIGLAANSITALADAVNNLSDAVSSVLTMVGFRLSTRPADEDHPYGHARYEQITSLIVSVIILCVGVLFAKSSVEKIIRPQELEISAVTYAVLSFAVLLKLAQLYIYVDFAKAISSQTLWTAATDSRNDVISTSAVILSMAVMQIFDVNIDGWAGLAISVFVIWSAVLTVKRSVSAMLGTPPTDDMVSSICSLIEGRDHIIGWHDLIVHSYGAGTAFASVHAEVDAGCDIVTLHDIIDGIERRAKSELGINLTIHMDPVDTADKRRQHLYMLALEALKQYDRNAEIHDFCVADGDDGIKVLFDIVEPFGQKYDIEQIKQLLQKAYINEEGTFYFVINVDKKMNR